MTTKQTGLQMAIAHAGGRATIRRLLSIGPKTLQQWEAADDSRAQRDYPNPAVQRAVDAAGSWQKLADALGVSRQRVGQFLKDGYMPPEHAKQVEMQFGILRAELVSPKVRSNLGLGGEL